MTEFLKNFQPFGMNFRKFRNHVYEFCQFEDARSVQISSVVCEKNSEKATHLLGCVPVSGTQATYLPQLRFKTDPYVRNFM